MKAYIGLSCKVGAFNQVIDELIKLNLSKKDIFLLFGPVDILIQIRGLKTLDEFVNKWFNPIKNITAQESLILRTQTLIVLSEGNQYVEEPYAFLFLNTQPRYIELVQEKLQAIPEVLSVDTVLGPFDAIAAVKTNGKLDLKRLVSQIQETVPHIQGTVTAVVASLY